MDGYAKPTVREFTASEKGFSHIIDNVAKAFLSFRYSIPLAKVQRQ